MKLQTTKILLIGTQAARLSPLIPPTCDAGTAGSMLEAILATDHDQDVVLVDVADELDQLETGIRSLRRMNADARIILLCEPAHELTCRRAMAWGADGYEILPLDQPALMAACEGRSETVVNDAGVRELTLPLSVQRDLMEEIFEGGNRPDFGARATAALAQHLGLEGSLVFHPDDPELPRVAGDIRQKVMMPGQLPFGMLIWKPEGSVSPPSQFVLEQAAAWLASLLAVARRSEQLRQMAITDELSGAYNRRYFLPKLAMVLKEATENHSHVTLLLFDIDNFKKYNDTFGHAAGDAIIRELIKILHACTRPYDLVARIGGDEFAVVFRDNEAPRQPNSSHPKDVLAATERFREAIRNHHWPEACKIQGTISISGGLATFPWDANSLEQLMSKADEALLMAKAKGKNVIVLTGRQGAPV